MAMELAELAAGLPVAASFAAARGISSFREGRRRTSLNEAMHELRRPLQILSLALPARAGEDAAVDSSLRLATAPLISRSSTCFHRAVCWKRRRRDGTRW